MSALAPPHPTTRTAPSDSYRLGRVLLFMMAMVVFDVRDFFTHGGKARYVLLLIPFGMAFSLWQRKERGVVRRLSHPDKILLALTVIGLGGAIWGTFISHTSSTTLPVFLPMTVAFTYLLTLQEPSDEELWKLLRGLALIGLLYTFMNAVANSGVAGSLVAAKVYRNSQVFFILMGIAAAIATKRRVVLAATLALAGFVFITYPSGTDVVVTLVAAITLWVTRPHASRRRPYVVAVLAVFALGFSIFNLTTLSSTASNYFSTVGKRDNTNTRLALWKGGVDEFLHSPVYGSAFSGEITILVYRLSDNRAPFKAPFHDDYIMFLAVGGVVGLALLLWWLAATELNVIRRQRAFIDAGRPARARFLRSLLVGFNVFFAAALFNPGLSGAGRCSTVFAIYAMMMMVGSPRRRAPAPRGRVPGDVVPAGSP